MTSRLLRSLGKLYPKAWRERYGNEVDDLSEELLTAGEINRPRLVLGLAVSAFVERVRSLHRGRVAMLSGCAVLVVVLVAVGVSLLGTNGTRPIPGSFIAVASQGRVVGYASRADLGLGTVVPVYDKNLTLVGHMYPGVGFVPLGTSPSSEPCVPETVIENNTNHPVACPSSGESLPNVIGMFTPTATAELSSLSLSLYVVNIHSKSVPRGHIVNMSPRPGSRVGARTVITVENSIG